MDISYYNIYLINKENEQNSIKRISCSNNNDLNS